MRHRALLYRVKPTCNDTGLSNISDITMSSQCTNFCMCLLQCSTLTGITIEAAYWVCMPKHAKSMGGGETFCLLAPHLGHTSTRGTGNIGRCHAQHKGKCGACRQQLAFFCFCFLSYISHSFSAQTSRRQIYTYSQ